MKLLGSRAQLGHLVFTLALYSPPKMPQLPSIPSPSPLSSAMQIGWHILGKGLKASPGCWFTNDLPQKPSQSFLPCSLMPTDYLCAWKLSNLETELLLEWCDESKILLRSLHQGFIQDICICWQVGDDACSRIPKHQSEMPVQLLMSKLNTK